MLELGVIFQIIKEKFDKIKVSERIDIINFLNGTIPQTSRIIVNKPCDFQIINLEDVYYIRNPKKKIAHIELENESFEYALTGERCLERIEEENSYLRFLNHNVLVNINKIIAYDSFLNRVYFSRERWIDVTGVAIKNIIRKELGSSLDLAKYTQIGRMDYFPF